MRLAAVASLGLLSPASAVILTSHSAPVLATSPGVCTSNEALRTKFGEWFSASVPLGGATTKARNIVPAVRITVAAVRLQIKATSVAGARWSLVLRDPAQRVLAILTEEDFGLAPGGTSTQWTGRLETSQVSAELIGASPGVSLVFVSGMALPSKTDGSSVFSIQSDRPQWQDPFQAPTNVAYEKAAEAVGMLVTGTKLPDQQGIPQNETWCCSGAMLTSDIFVTNWHCGGAGALADGAYWNTQVQSNGIIDLGWQTGKAPRRQYSVVKLLRANERLDYALLRVRPTIGPGGATGRAVPVTVETSLPAAGDEIFLIHHAQCQMKLVSYAHCKVAGVSYRAWTDPITAGSGPDLTHQCDTEPGASGAPVFDIEGRMIALHHLGFQQPAAGAQCQSDKLNKAVSMASIFADVQQGDAALYSELTHH